MKKQSRRFIIVCSSLIVVMGIFVSVYYWNHNKNILDEKDIDNYLPMTKKVDEHDKDPEAIAYRLFFDLMGKFKESGLLANASFSRFHLLEGKEDTFVVAVVFQVELGEGIKDTSWGDVQADRMVDGLVWKLNIKRDADQTYTLESIEKSTDTLIGLPPVEDSDTYKKEADIEESDDNRYEIVGDKLNVTYNNGEDWVNVPVSFEELFEGEYSGPKDSLIEGSYLISPERTAFVLGGGQRLRLLQTTDQGKSWDDIVITDQMPGIRMRLLGFTSEREGYLIVTYDRTMSSEANVVLKTHDGGESWKVAGSVDEITSLVTDGGFINDDLGFISFGSYNSPDQPSRPWLYRTADGGSNWEEVEVPIPDEYKGIFTIAEIPTFNGSQGTLLVNQGPEGDYVGGNVLAKFTSEDAGETWSFSGLVDPDEVFVK